MARIWPSTLPAELVLEHCYSRIDSAQTVGEAYVPTRKEHSCTCSSSNWRRLWRGAGVHHRSTHRVGHLLLHEVRVEDCPAKPKRCCTVTEDPRMPNYKLNKWQTFWRLLVLFLVGEVILFGAIVYFYDLTKLQMLLLSLTAVLMIVIFIVRTWNNPALDE